MHQEQLHELLYQALETERGGIHVYQTALQCTVNEELKTSGRNISSRPKNMNTSCASSSTHSSSILNRRPQDGRWSATSDSHW